MVGLSLWWGNSEISNSLFCGLGSSFPKSYHLITLPFTYNRSKKSSSYVKRSKFLFPHINIKNVDGKLTLQKANVDIMSDSIFNYGDKNTFYVVSFFAPFFFGGLIEHRLKCAGTVSHLYFNFVFCCLLIYPTHPPVLLLSLHFITDLHVFFMLRHFFASCHELLV